MEYYRFLHRKKIKSAYLKYFILDNYTANADAYYRKLVDMNDTSVNDIVKVFEEVRNIDS